MNPFIFGAEIEFSHMKPETDVIHWISKGRTKGGRNYPYPGKIDYLMYADYVIHTGKCGKYVSLNCYNTQTHSSEAALYLLSSVQFIMMKKWPEK